MMKELFQKHSRNWYDYNQYNSKEGEYLNYFNTQVIPNRSIVKNKGIIPKVPKIIRNLKLPNGIPNGPNEPIWTKPDYERSESVGKDSKDSIPKIPDSLKYSKGKTFKPSNTSIPEDVLMKARFAQASKIYYSEGLTSAQDYIDSFGYNFTIEPDVSTGIGLVLIDNDTGEITISYRGTDIKNPTDLLTDTLAFAGAETYSPEYTNVKEQLETVTELYGKPKELVGFSRGSVLSMNLGNEYSIPTTELNPLISPSLVLTQDSGSKHEIFRTLNDPVSILAATTTEDSNWNVRSIAPIQETLNPYDEHMLKQLLTNDTPQRLSNESIEPNAVVDSLHPTSQLKGLIGGAIGYSEAKSIDKLTGGALGDSGVSGVAGSLGAVNTSILSSALAGSAEGLTAAALLPEAIAGGAGGLAGYYSGQAVAKSLQRSGANKDTIQSVSAISGGAVGGASAAAVGVGVSVATAAATGGEIGTLLAPETAGASILIGAGIGATVGAGSYVVGQASSAGSALLSSITSNKIDPYYVKPDYDSSDMNSVMDYMKRQQSMVSLQRQDEAQGITPEQRVEINRNNQQNNNNPP